MGEMYGSMHYVAHNPERIRRTVAAMCVDTPAASYDLAGTEYTFYMNPHVAKDFTDAFILKVASEYLPKVNRPWHEKEFTTGTDTYLAEPMVGVPTVWGYSGSGVETHHNSEDTPDRVDERSLRDISVIDASFLYFIANAGEPEALWLARLSESRGYDEILKAASPFLDRIAARRESRSTGQAARRGGSEDRVFGGSGEPGRVERSAPGSGEPRGRGENGSGADAGRLAPIRRSAVRPDPRRGRAACKPSSSAIRDSPKPRRSS